MTSRRHVLAGVGGALTAGLAGCLGDSGSSGGSSNNGTAKDTDWPMPRFDTTNTAYNPEAKAPRHGVLERWTFEGASATGTPAIVDGRVFLPTGKSLVALDSSSGGVLWQFDLDHGWSDGPVVHDGLVYVNALGDLHALDVKTGEKAWSLTDVEDINTSPHLVAGEHVSPSKLFVGTENGKLLKLDLKTGRILRRTDLFGEITTMAYRLPILYVGTSSGEVYALFERGTDRPFGEQWRRKVGAQIQGLVPTSEGILVDTFGGPLRCLQDGAHAGTTRWKVPAKQANSAPVYGNYTVFAAGYDSLSAHRDYDKKTKWRYNGRFDRADPVAAGDTLYVSSGDAVHGFALDGGIGMEGYRYDAKQWSHSTSLAVEGLAVADGALFVACRPGKGESTALYCLESA
ncbi:MULTISPECIES: PQQ-binding-like beta-propeller repeat protein [unclassified Haladaptatus]|uniref:outer membrane protein assembly factor BamB family protein n=1 Tax=unclassified Haladaptatus TaxID=2622732 RepID=UPI00209BE21C|nr:MULTISPECIES: PQQ-binding-like beta-propeller repeat protein [unclassified Haladaptatus]MCO8246569.1 PQQ-binding-like beta-propeller repeat protein [Haladaptatus sp. AB643]MCO8256309.1 PQQ-binding-like beta-propeller repeat protein [Haladaptatus sp. AB618]